MHFVPCYCLCWTAAYHIDYCQSLWIWRQQISIRDGYWSFGYKTAWISVDDSIWEREMAWIGMRDRILVFAITRKIMGKCNMAKDVQGFLARFRFVGVNIEEVR